VIKLPGFDCGLCGCKSCLEFSRLLSDKTVEAVKCPHLRSGNTPAGAPESGTNDSAEVIVWKDSHGREFDFILETFPGDPGPRETILLYNPARVAEQDIRPGDIVMGRPMGMSCGCPVTHCGVVMETDPANGVFVWCIVGPLTARSGQTKDIGYYSAQAYEGLVRDSRTELRVGVRYWFLPRRCMLQWRHSGLVNFIDKSGAGTRVRIEGLMIG